MTIESYGGLITMMFYYEVYVGGSFASRSVLSYSSHEIIPERTLVKVPLRAKTVLGIVKKRLESKPIEFEVKSIKTTLPFAFSEAFMTFITLCVNNTFNPESVVIDKVLAIWDSFIDKDWTQIQQLLTNNTHNFDSKTTAKALFDNEYMISNDILVRIMYIIRSDVKIYGLCNQLILVPELKYISKFLNQIFEMIHNPDLDLLARLDCTRSEFDTIFQNYSFVTLDSTTSRSSRDSTIQMQTQQNLTVLGTRSSLFIPFNHLTSLTLIEESSPFYIQEQNSLYFDAREIAYLRAFAEQTQINYISSLPSSRLLTQYNEETVSNWLSNDTSKPYITQDVQHS